MVETVNVKLGTDVDCRTPYVCMGNAATTKMPSNSATGRGEATECSESQRNEWASHNSTSHYLLRKYECEHLSHPWIIIVTRVLVIGIYVTFGNSMRIS
ncbi:uncharacterized protein EAE98_008759 [Botrytis deweyae]|uniref:Uncharacterized protein n=1 Tax=Botrytis deweyae TaxID=2478750 RepID=A0ABQ7IDD7_9HELO|nr:uncharacterized protein EAE98_008759 [Botrytis deweyae]KAF7920730.1 hypothetical protein EAE98_008759 [Botrytis deweyae]